MLEGFSDEEYEFLRWMMGATQGIIGSEMSWAEYCLVLWVIQYCIETGLYRELMDERQLFAISDIDREYRKREGVGIAV